MEILIPMRRATLRRYFTGIAAVFLAVTGMSAQAAQSLEYDVKAAFLYKFAAYVEWPAAVFPTPQSPITLCVAGADPFGPNLDNLVQNQRIGERPILLRRIPAVAKGSGCQILYLGNSSQSTVDALAATHGEPILTVTDNAPTAGIVNFVLQNDSVRFQIDDKAASESGLSISSRLLSVATSVKPR